MEHLLAALDAMPTPAWVALSGACSAIGSWFVALKTLRTSLVKDQALINAQQFTQGIADQAKFREALLEAITVLRKRLADCENDRTSLHERIATLEEQLAVQEASVEILRRWIEFFRSQSTATLPPLPAMFKPLPPASKN